jgi:TolA-binding protein
MRRWTAVAPAVLIAAAGCLASKSDIRLLQDEAGATRAQLAQGDSSILRAEEARRMQIAALSSKLDLAMDSLRSVATRLASFQARANGEFDALNDQMVKTQALLGQTTRNIQETKAQIQAMKEQGSVAPPPPSSGSVADSSAAAAAAAGIPGPATLYASALESTSEGAYATARRALEQLLTSYPNYEQAPRALLRIGDTYHAERNLIAADSVYQLVTERYPKDPAAATALYLRGKPLWDANKRSQAMVYFNRVTRDFPDSPEASLIKDLTRSRE